MSALRNFLITLLVSLIIFGFLAYGVVQFAEGAFELDGKKPVTNNSAENETPPDILPPTPDNMATLKGESFTALFIGTDYLPDVYNDYETPSISPDGFPLPLREVHTDTLIIVRMNKETGECIFCPIPANTQVTINGHTSALRELYSKKGVDALKEQITALIGIPIDYYAITTIQNMTAIIDLLGGIEFYVPENMKFVDEITGIETELKKGNTRLDGKKALDMLRYCSYKDGDDTRRIVGADFLKAIAAKVVSDIDIKNIGAAFITYGEYIETNFSFNDLTKNLDLIFAFNKMSSKLFTYPGRSTGISDNALFIPNIDEAYKFFNKYKFKG